MNDPRTPSMTSEPGGDMISTSKGLSPTQSLASNPNSSGSISMPSMDNPSSINSGAGAASPTTVLKPTREENSGFVFPAIWSFTAFYTHHRIFFLDLNTDSQAALGVESLGAASNTEGTLEGVLSNRKIRRRLLPSSLKEIVKSMEKDGSVTPEPPKQNTRYLIYWRKPDEWARLLYEYVTENGLNGTIMTFYELVEGDMAHTTEFYKLPYVLLRRALELLVKQGKATLIKGEEESQDGVKFF